ncbi:histidine kinase [Microbacterium sp.]|uniref:sensor histidine kinase n=1 Tax=Microbacterium sp. TaxID=51671 RepID=UPI0028113410|nr:histidine kinase [Microbacterium sp.]
MAPAERSFSAVSVAAGTVVVALGVLGVVAALIAADPSEQDVPTSTSWWTAAVLALQAAALLLPRLHGAPLLVASALPMALPLTAPGSLFSVTALPVVVGAFLSGMQIPFRRLRWIAAASGVLVMAGQLGNAVASGRTDYAGAGLEALLQAVLVVGLPLLPATAIRAQRAARRAQQETLEAVARQRDAQIGEAIALERAAMARELHDIAAHHLSGISVMASALERQIGSDPDGARAGAAAVRAQSRAVLDDLRRLVGLLRDADGADDVVKTLATVPALVDAASVTGADVVLDIRRPPTGALGEGIGPLAQLAAYRMVQESLTNAARYAPHAPCTVTIDDQDPALLRVTVRNARPLERAAASASGSGFGILGMRERAALIGGSFDAGPAGDGGWEARMSIPRERVRPDRKQTP